MRPSPIQRITFAGRSFFLKRDDLLHPHLSGNKARKFHFLQQKRDIKEIQSFGSLHSNAMYSLSFLAKERGLSFIYYARPDPSLKNPKGNLGAALENGMILRPLEDWPYSKELSHTIQIGSCLYLPEGGRCPEAEEGIAILAKEILEWAKKERKSPTVFLPSGTGTTALFLQKYLPFQVYTIPCVGGEAYLWEQFEALDPTAPKPIILPPPKKYRFGRLYLKLFELWRELKAQTGVTFDLLYDPVGFATLLHHDLLDEDLLYIHQGGIMGNETMIERYKAKLDKIAKTDKGAQ